MDLLATKRETEEERLCAYIFIKFRADLSVVYRLSIFIRKFDLYYVFLSSSVCVNISCVEQIWFTN